MSKKVLLALSLLAALLFAFAVMYAVHGQIAKEIVQYLIEQDKSLKQTKVLVMGVTFKENVSDIRNSKVPELINELKEFSINVDAVDPWADPKGEFLSGAYASPVYDLYGLKGLDKGNMPLLNSPVNDGHIGYHIRSGEHDLTYYDWEQFLNFADRFLK